MGTNSLHAQTAPALRRVEVTQNHMGMPVNLTIWSDNPAAARRAAGVAFEEVGRLNLILSDYEPQSELSRLCRRAGTGFVDVSEELFEVVQQARELAEQTDGLYDPTAAPLIRLWRKARSEQKLPDPEAVKVAKGLVGYEQLELDPAGTRIKLNRAGMLLDLGAIAKGYIGDAAVRSLREQGFEHVSFAAGGDMVVGAAPPGEEGWPIDPEPEGLPGLKISDAAVAISGDAVQFLEIEGKRYSHVIDPRTGQGMTTGMTCLVVAPSGMLADPIATIGTLMEPEDFRRWVAEHYPEAEVWLERREPATQPAAD